MAFILVAAVPLAAKPATYGVTPLMFERNDGQLADAVQFHGRGAGYSVFLTGNETILRLHRAKDESAIVRWQLEGANAGAPMRGQSMLAAKSNYLHGSDAAKWRTNVANFSSVRQTNVYPGIDVVYRGNDRQLEYDFVLAPRADASRIRMNIRGAQSMSIDSDGALVLHLDGGDLVQPRPVVYQERNGKRSHVNGRYALLDKNHVGFILGHYDRSRPVIIDPVLLYATYLGGNLWDSSIGIGVDSSGNAYITGLVESTNFPTLNAIQSTDTYDYDAYLAKFNSSGGLVYSTYLGGNGGNEYGYNVVVDSSNNVYIVGGTNSTDFPGVTAGSIMPSYGGGSRDVFLTKINSSGSAIVYSTYLGGNGDEWAYGLAVDSSGNAYVAGGTASTNLIGVSGGSLQSAKSSSNDGFAMKINAAGSAVVYSTYIGGTGNDSLDGIRLDASNNLWISGTSTGTSFPGVTGSSLQSTNGGGYDGIVLQLNSTFSSIPYATFLGGSGDESCTTPVLDGSGNVLVSGYTSSTTFPGVSGSSLQSTNGGGNDAYLTKFNSTLSSYVFSTFFGGSGYDDSVDVYLDSSGNIYFGGSTNSSALPGVGGTSMQPSLAGDADLFFAKLNSTATSITWATYLGGSLNDVAYAMAKDSSNNLYMSGVLISTDFPTTPGAAQTTHAGGDGDAFVAKVGDPGTPVITSVSPTSGRAGDSITITGYNFDNYQGAGGQVWLGSKNAGTITSWSNRQIVATIASGSSSGSVQVKQNGVWSNSIAFTVLTPVITSVSPTSGRAGDSITINGNYFGASGTTAQVWLGNKVAGSIVSWSDTQVVATIASGASSGTVQIQAGGVWYNYGAFTVITPNISSVSPTTGYSGDTVTINGTGFGSTQGSGRVWLGTKDAGSIVSWSDTQIVATIASGSKTGSAQVYQNGVWSNTIAFTVITPVVTSISPTSGPVGTQVTINGTGFRSAQGSGSVWIGTKTAGSIVSWSDTQIVATVATGSATGATQVLQGGVWSNSITFTVTP